MRNLEGKINQLEEVCNSPTAQKVNSDFPANPPDHVAKCHPVAFPNSLTTQGIKSDLSVNPQNSGEDQLCCQVSPGDFARGFLRSA
ncbi:MAG: hypothetical protein ACRC8A_20110 [Microcoleaceae cyanobacterium]